MKYSLGILADAKMNHPHMHNLMRAGRSKNRIKYKITRKPLSTLKVERALAMTNACSHYH